MEGNDKPYAIEAKQKGKKRKKAKSEKRIPFINDATASDYEEVTTRPFLQTLFFTGFLVARGRFFFFTVFKKRAGISICKHFLIALGKIKRKGWTYI